MAQVLEEFEKELEPRLPAQVAQDFKALVRRKIQALAVDCIEIMELEPGTEINGHALAVRDSVRPDSALARQGAK